jgi:hypothetical protein
LRPWSLLSVKPWQLFGKPLFGAIHFWAVEIDPVVPLQKFAFVGREAFCTLRG